MLDERNRCSVGASIKYAPGEIQQEQAEKEAVLERIAAHENRMPTLPALPKLEDFDRTTGRFVGGAGLPRVAGAHEFEGNSGRRSADLARIIADLPDLSPASALPAIEDGQATEATERVPSVLEENPGFYIHCKVFLPKATPEQHFEVFGVGKQLSREEWVSFVTRERAMRTVDEDTSRKRSRNRSQSRGCQHRSGSRIHGLRELRDEHEERGGDVEDSDRKDHSRWERDRTRCDEHREDRYRGDDDGDYRERRRSRHVSGSGYKSKSERRYREGSNGEGGTADDRDRHVRRQLREQVDDRWRD
jgi:hypothetical protein